MSGIGNGTPPYGVAGLRLMMQPICVPGNTPARATVEARLASAAYQVEIAVIAAI